VAEQFQVEKMISLSDLLYALEIGLGAGVFFWSIAFISDVYKKK
jgi:hypothetical protein